jgi:hypothetical protein
MLHIYISLSEADGVAKLQFLELVKNWDGGSFHRPAGHVLQVYKPASIPSFTYWAQFCVFSGASENEGRATGVPRIQPSFPPQ